MSSSSSLKPLKSFPQSDLETWATATDMVAHTTTMGQAAKAGAPLTDAELDTVLASLEHVSAGALDTAALRTVLKEIAHISHKNWDVTKINAQRLLPHLFPEVDTSADVSAFPSDAEGKFRFARILEEGNWYGAADHAAVKDASAPWAVLVTGVNGIRKTTSLYQPWFGELLSEALVVPSDGAVPAVPELPTGQNSFFRQLDHMIVTLCNREFALLYALTEGLLQSQGTDAEPTAEIIQAYSNLKASLFSRYRTLSELLGVLLLEQASRQTVPLNCLLETSGRDVAMFHYVDKVFPTNYRKLVLHFQINDLTQAQASVDRRMVTEIKTGIGALHQTTEEDSLIDTPAVIRANAGGPYGSEVLPGVQESSDQVWTTVLDGSAGVGQDWYKATIQINAYAEQPWTAQAVRPDGSLGTTLYTFERKS